ncbi:GNAT family N-acetyltransferase [Halapricum desulfuricans]|uniref:Acetyltransferase (GNAT) family n=1 Tax=Halapricum desulfuricans TaxID=2841257 RepID=A0A897NAW9_9EURY|nr:GNAT family N-acetyltransferase [Halapricum desulfuricans]QSG08129.1 Acetyltransferase (GNAT) family [Halapricum desulfuricans]
MTLNRTYPDEPAGEFPRPPRTITDREDREIEIRVAEPDDRDALVEMYSAFDPSDRAQGIPPVKEYAIDNWLDTVLAEDCLNVIAWDGEDAVGHAMLVPDNEDAHELAIFVLHTYQGAGIGTGLLETLLGHAQREGIETVWLTVERWNEPAIELYKKVGFEICGTESFEIEMSIRLH